ncbi:GNAT family N-acetyltransferase [Gracilimonas sediminicola]|uniref:GNAT family N-acetyltransferase n=1 Tax=Gracilimonas sediminicola TaxID=2952158 RepID=UPI0038D3CD65
MNIRHAKKEDLPAVLTMNNNAVPHVTSEEISDMEYYLQEASPFLIIEEEDEPMGFMIVLQKGLDYESLNYKFFCKNYDDFDYVDRIVISEKFRGRKLGTALYRYLAENSEQKYITCEVNLEPPNPNSLGFHKALGFNNVADQETEGGKKKVALMVKRL